MTTYVERLHSAIRAKQTPVVVGLDPRRNQLPAELRGPGNDPQATATAYEAFCCRIIDVVGPLVPAVKPQSAFFEAQGPAGMQALAHVIHYARRAGMIVVCDAKRNDIGSTAQSYAEGFLAGTDPSAAHWGADALTVSPYLGVDTLEPFVSVAVERGAGIYVLVRTSNPGAGAFQDLESHGRKLYQHVGRAVDELAAETRGEELFGVVGAVVGATYPDELAELRSAMPYTHFLIPGYGSQGAGGADVAAAFDDNGLGAIVNSSRGINFAHNREPYKSRFGEQNWEAAVEAATQDMIDDLAANTPAGKLRKSQGTRDKGQEP